MKKYDNSLIWLNQFGSISKLTKNSVFPKKLNLLLYKEKNGLDLIISRLKDRFDLLFDKSFIYIISSKTDDAIVIPQKVFDKEYAFGYRYDKARVVFALLNPNQPNCLTSKYYLL